MEIVERGKAVGSLRSADVSDAEVFVEGRSHVVSVIGGGAQPERDRSGRTLLKITITAEVDGVRRDYAMAFSRRGSDNAALGRAYAGADTPGQGGGSREVLSPREGPYGEGAGSVPQGATAR